MINSNPRIIYARGFPYGAPLCMIRGGATKLPEVREFLKAEGFYWDGSRYAWEHYLGRQEFGPILKNLRDRFGCEVIPKDTMDSSYLIDLDSPRFGRPGEREEHRCFSMHGDECDVCGKVLV